MREKGDKPKPEPKRAKGGLVKGALAERIRGDPQVQRVRRARAGTILCRLLAQLQAREHDKFAAHLYRSRREYRSACERAGKGGKQIERRIHLDISDRREHGIQGRLSAVGVLAAGRRLKVRSADVRPSRSHLDLR